MEVGPGNDFWKFSSVGNKVKQLASSYVLEDNCETFVSRFILFFIGGVFPDIKKTN